VRIITECRGPESDAADRTVFDSCLRQHLMEPRMYLKYLVTNNLALLKVLLVSPVSFIAMKAQSVALLFEHAFIFFRKDAEQIY
jgi:hypothetical protein